MDRKALLGACALAVLASGLAATTVQAADEEGTTVGEVVITGSSIRGVAATGSPAVRIDSESIKEAGATRATDVTRALPQVLNLGADESRNSFTGGAQDAAANATAVRSVNLRGLGPEATLLLINGRRTPPSGVIKAISDLDVIPTAAISRLEVVADGASAIYGTDAVAGVVNLVTPRSYEGAETLVRYGGADHYDQFIFSQTFGGKWDYGLGGGGFIAYEKNKHTNLQGKDRDFATQNRTARAAAQCAAANVNCDARPFTAAPGNIVISGTRYALPPGNGTNINPASIVVGANRFDEANFADLFPAQNRDSVFLNLHQNVTSTIDVWYEFWQSNRTFDLAAPPALFSLSVTNANPYYVRPAGAPAGTSETVEYRFLDDSDPNSNGYERTNQHAVGFGWNVTKEWRVEGYADWGWDHGLQRRQSVLNNTVLRAALASTNPATAFNPFGDGTFNRTNNADLVEKIDGERYQYATSKTDDYQIKADGPLFKMAGGEVKLAVGVDYHDNKFEQALYATNVTADASVSTKFVNNKRQITAGFVELFVPLVSEANALPFVKRLNLSIADRYEDYSDFGGANNPKFGLVWGPIDDLNIRGTWGTSFRAPSLVDSADQIRNVFIQDLTNTSGTLHGIFYNGGNSALQPEEATTWTAGFDWTPKAVSGLRITGTYYNIEYTNRIDVTPNTALTNPAYAPFVTKRPSLVTAGADDTAFNALVASFMASPDLQNPVEPVSNINAIIDGRRANLGSLYQDGVDIGLAYDFSNGWGDWSASLDVSKILGLSRVTAPGLAKVDVLDTFGNPVDLRYRAGLGWRRGGWSANGFLNYVDEYRNTAVTPNQKVDDWTTVDASVSYKFESNGYLKDTRIVLSGQNLFDTDPPVVVNGTVSWDNQAASAMGRFLSIEVSKKW